MVAGGIIFLTALLLLALGINAYYKTRKGATGNNPVNPAMVPDILRQRVDFYQELNAADQAAFTERVCFFLSRIKITPVKGAVINDEDRVLIAAAGVIPLFRYQNWFYNNLNEVLVYPEAFNMAYEQEGGNRNIIGIVGDGALHRTMILSLPYLRSGFSRNAGSNTAIHEFAHLLDKSDGAADGVPELILQDANIKPWVQSMHQYIQAIRYGKTEINPYGATNEAEFFAVMAEYFFQQPEKLKEKHPDLYTLLNTAFENKESNAAAR